MCRRFLLLTNKMLWRVMSRLVYLSRRFHVIYICEGNWFNTCTSIWIKIKYLVFCAFCERTFWSYRVKFSFLKRNETIIEPEYCKYWLFCERDWLPVLYVLQYVFSPEPVPKGTKGAQTVHEELAKNLTTILRPANADNVVVCKFLKYSWFFFEILIKSMALYLISTDRIKVGTLF